MAFDVFKGLMQMENARVTKAHAAGELAVRKSYMGALTATQELQSTLLKQRLDSGLVELERQAKSTQLKVGKQQFKMLKTRNRKMREMLDSDDETEKLMATSALLGINALSKSDDAIKQLTLQNQQMQTQLQFMAFGLRENKARQDSAGEILNLATALSEAGLSKEIFGEEGDVFMKQAVRNALIAYLGGDLPSPETVPPVAPETPGFFQSFKSKLGLGPGSPAGEGIPTEEEAASFAERSKLKKKHDCKIVKYDYKYFEGVETIEE